MADSTRAHYRINLPFKQHVNAVNPYGYKVLMHFNLFLSQNGGGWIQL